MVFQTSTHNEYGIDRTLLIERLKLTPTQRIQEHSAFMEFVEALQKSVKKKHDPISKNSRDTQ